MDVFEKFSEDRLSNRSKLFSSVKNKHISEKIYIHMLPMFGMPLK